jgi:hypothetical protein
MKPVNINLINEGYENVKCMKLAEDRGHFRNFVLTVMNYRF